MSQWIRDRWWRVLKDDGTLWCETSDEEEARRSMRPGATKLQKLWRREQFEWRDEK